MELTIQSEFKQISIPLDKLIEAPSSWNFYDAIPPSKMAELVESILTIGLLHPIVIWAQNDGNYMILSGHNRVKAFKILTEQNIESYSNINAIIKTQFEITEEIAKQIIIDTNWVQRELTPIQRAKSISRKYAHLKQESLKSKIKLDINQIIATTYNISKRQIINYKFLANLIPEVYTYIDDSNITIKAGVKIAKLPENLQLHIYKKYLLKNKFKIINQKYNLLKDTMSIKEINDILKKDDCFIGRLCIQYPGMDNDGEYKKAYVTYPKEDEKYFHSLIDTFCGGRHDLLIFEDNTYKEGDFIFTKIN